MSSFRPPAQLPDGLMAGIYLCCRDRGRPDVMERSSVGAGLSRNIGNPEPVPFRLRSHS